MLIIAGAHALCSPRWMRFYVPVRGVRWSKWDGVVRFGERVRV